MNNEGFRKLKLVGKKTTGRTVVLDQELVNVFKAYQQERNAIDDDVMFQAGDGADPSNKWTKIISKFFDKHGMRVKSHDFRVTQATDYFEQTKDVVAVKGFLGHASINTTERYIKKSEKEIAKATEGFLIDQAARKRQRTSV